jgi:hypothetical protein
MEVMIAMGRAVQSVGGGCLEDEPFLAMRSGLCIVLTRMRRYRHYSVPKTRLFSHGSAQYRGTPNR